MKMKTLNDEQIRATALEFTNYIQGVVLVEHVLQLYAHPFKDVAEAMLQSAKDIFNQSNINIPFGDAP